MHPRVVELLLRRTAALVVVLTLGAAGWAECAGWQATPEARMACCSSSGDCPMHGSTEPGAGSERVVTQAQADRLLRGIRHARLDAVRRAPSPFRCQQRW